MPNAQTLAEVRAHIDALDAGLVRLLAQRQDLVRQAAAFKSDEGAVRAPDRVERVITTVRDLATTAGLDPAVAEAIWRTMIDTFIQLELTEHRRAPLPHIAVQSPNSASS